MPAVEGTGERLPARGTALCLFSSGLNLRVFKSVHKTFEAAFVVGANSKSEVWTYIPLPPAAGNLNLFIVFERDDFWNQLCFVANSSSICEQGMHRS